MGTEFNSQYDKIVLSLSCFAAESLLAVPLLVCGFLAYMCIFFPILTPPEGNNFARTEFIQSCGILALPENKVS